MNEKVKEAYKFLQELRSPYLARDRRYEAIACFESILSEIELLEQTIEDTFQRGWKAGNAAQEAQDKRIAELEIDNRFLVDAIDAAIKDRDYFSDLYGEALSRKE